MRNPWKLTSLLLVGLLASSVTTSAFADRQPRMKVSLRLMFKARTSLKAASSDKGGHRVKAVELLDGAIAEVEAGIAFDNTH
jgi:hypothetical protein